MMKKILLVAFAVLLYLCQPANAKCTEVTAMSDLDVENPPETFTIKLNQDVVLDNGKIIPQGSVVENQIYKAKQAKRLKMKANLIVKISKVTDPEGNEYTFNKLYAKYTKPIDKLNTGKEAAVSVANHFVKNITLPYHALEGAVKNGEGNRAKSALKGAYDASPLSYLEKGEDININDGDTLYLDFGFFDPENASVADKVKYR